MSRIITYEDIVIMSDYIASKMIVKPKIGIVCGTGLGDINSMITNPLIIKFENIPKLPRTTGKEKSFKIVDSHAGQFVIGNLACGTPVICQQGRYHLYEGHDQSTINKLITQIVAPIRLMKFLGVEIVILTNAAGGINQSYCCGDIMVIKDHLYFPGLVGNSPLIGPNDARFGDRFPSLYNLYDRDLRSKLLDCARELNFDFVREGIYASVAGPHFETNFEMRFLMKNGCDAVGIGLLYKMKE
ncbi:LOW QUALITY PROTEIN: purine nucleoside phosphorylase 1-like [Octopus sinensis]|uniref:purine-nucleoside phosphorylase n=1 Tax=Octopus sinensis TaxID=2607531 RepID=A0A6P7TTP6_9MOLL|nr:LOW QUALITY PROTEIN: purine nucleoside phosphorylase 1-like [Octopus sinensis]